MRERKVTIHYNTIFQRAKHFLYENLNCFLKLQYKFPPILFLKNLHTYKHRHLEIKCTGFLPGKVIDFMAKFYLCYYFCKCYQHLR